jgi:UDP-N-acetylmuramoyl-L-alanyl-D-glutamate--2,6-diaminopimelate ligase
MKNSLRKLIPDFLLSWYHFGWALLGAIIYRFPSRKLKVIGVTGTNGKSTVVFFISRILEEADYLVAALSSIQFKIGGKVWPNDLKMTMPGRLKIQQFLRRAVQAGCQYVVLEVTSEGIKQYRHKFISFNSVVFTNLTPEHLESHGGFENYKEAKGKLFQELKDDGKSIVNLDDPSAEYFMKFSAKRKIGYSVNSKAEFKLNLPGQFNLSNALAASSVAEAEGIPLGKIKVALEGIRNVPGRLEIVVKEPFTVIVDYAHTPDALEKVYQTVMAMASGRIIGILGAAGGGRDKWKRPQLGQIAEKYLDQIIITNEDPYDENPQVIIDQVAAGLERKPVQKILDRRQAIQQALKSAQKGDLVIITGKGCEPWMCVAGGKKIPWDDREIIRECFKSL